MKITVVLQEMTFPGSKADPKNWFSLPPGTSADDSTPSPILWFIGADLNLPVTLNVRIIRFC